MGTSFAIQLGLEDLLADLHYARRSQALGRLALLAYCEVKSWARQAGKPDIADGATKMFTETPCICKEEFLSNIDRLIATLECHQRSNACSHRTPTVSTEPMQSPMLPAQPPQT
jgi:hypothetical protein